MVCYVEGVGRVLKGGEDFGGGQDCVGGDGEPGGGKGVGVCCKKMGWQLVILGKGCEMQGRGQLGA